MPTASSPANTNTPSRMQRTKCFSVLCVLVANFAWNMGLAAAQEADADRLVLEWIAPPTCPPTSELRAMVARLLGGAIQISPDRTLDVRARVEQGATWRVEIETGSDPEVRRRLLESDSCTGLADATALIVALMIDPKAVEGDTHRRELAQSTPDSGSQDPADSPNQYLIGILGTSSLGILPSLDAGVGGRLGLLHGAWRFELLGSFGLRRDQIVAASSPAGAYGTFNYLGGSAGVCRDLGWRRLAIGPCTGVAFGILSAQGHGVTEGIAARTPWFGVGLGGYLAVQASRHVSFSLHAGLLVPLTRPEFVIHHVQGRVFRGSPVDAYADLGVEIHF
jgi:hypothetical protein